MTRGNIQCAAFFHQKFQHWTNYDQFVRIVLGDGSSIEGMKILLDSFKPVPRHAERKSIDAKGSISCPIHPQVRQQYDPHPHGQAEKFGNVSHIHIMPRQVTPLPHLLTHIRCVVVCLFRQEDEEVEGDKQLKEAKRGRGYPTSHAGYGCERVGLWGGVVFHPPVSVLVAIIIIITIIRAAI